MDVVNLINNFSNKMTNYFTPNPQNNSLDNYIIQINNKILLWIKDTINTSSNDNYITYISQKYTSKFLIFNISQTKLDTEISQDKIMDFNLPNNPSFTLEFLINFCISAENWINADNTNILIIYDDITINEGKIYYILSALISFHHIKKNDSIYEPISIYADLTSSKFSKKLGLGAFLDIKNNLRYLNCFSEIIKSPKNIFEKYYDFWCSSY